ncbi:MAG: TIGR01777 family protein [Nitrospinae bacterium]|nr:TIGR01777 family protein [Nitrospinota bacterium]
MNITVIGGSGFIGRSLCQFLVQEGHQVTVLSRNPEKARTRLGASIPVIKWNPLPLGTLEKVFADTDAIINLAGEPIADARWTKNRKGVLHDSRVGTTRLVVNALSNISKRPRVLMNASGIGFYGPQELTSVTEQTGPGIGFLAELCVDWEQEARRAEEYGVRVVQLRMGMVLAGDGGALPRMLLPFRLFIGGPIAPGHQKVSWIHLQDLMALIKVALVDETIHGAINAVSPYPVTMREFCQTLGHVLGRPSWLPVPALALRLGLGELATLMTTGQHVEPLVAQRLGFQFTYPTLESALQSIVKQRPRTEPR